jgi:hypothetical protein
MKISSQITHIKHLFTQGLRDYEICERLGTSSIFTRNAIANICYTDPAAESLHYKKRHLKGRKVRAQFINNDPYFEEVNRFDLRRQTQSV